VWEWRRSDDDDACIDHDDACYWGWSHDVDAYVDYDYDESDDDYEDDGGVVDMCRQYLRVRGIDRRGGDAGRLQGALSDAYTGTVRAGDKIGSQHKQGKRIGKRRSVTGLSSRTRLHRLGIRIDLDLTSVSATD
jgi:hypothetical protein